MKVPIRSSAVAACALLLALPVQAQTADEIVEKHLAAVGGRTALAKLETRTATGAISVTTQGMTFSGTAELYYKAPNKSRSVIRLDLSAAGAGEAVVEQRCDGKVGWTSNSLAGDRELSGTELQATLNARFPSPLLDYKQAGDTVELVGKDKVGDRPVFVLKYTPKAGPVVTMFLDAETYLLTRSVTKIDVPEVGGEVERTTDLADYRDVAGIKVPFSVTNTSSIQGATIVLSKVEHNVALDDALFARK